MEQEIIPNSLGEFPIAASVGATKTVNNGDNTISWVEGDQMSVIYTQAGGGYGNATYTRVEGDIFNGKVKDAGDKMDLYTVYPTNESDTPERVLYTIPSVQTQNGNGSQAHIAGANLPLYGSKTNVDKAKGMPVIQMSHVAAVIDFKITNNEDSSIKVKEVKFTSPSDMVGDFSTNLTTAPSLSWKPEKPGKTVTLSVADGAEIAAGASAEFFATVLPFGGEGEYKFEVLATDADGNQIVSEKTASHNFEFPAGKCTTITYPFVKTGEPEQPVTAKTYTKTNKIEAGKAYVIVSNNNALKNASGSATAYSVSGKLSGETLTIPAEDVNSVEWTSTAAPSTYSSKGDFSFTNNGFMIARKGSGQDDIIFDATDSARSYWSLDNQGNDLSQNNSDGTVTLYIQYTSKWTAKSQTETNAVAVYVADPSSPVTPPTPPTPGTVSGYELITSEPSDWTGTYLLVSADKKYLFNGENGNGGSGSSGGYPGTGGYPGMGGYYPGTGGTSSSNAVTLSSSDFDGNVITNSAYSQYAFSIVKSGSSYYIKKGNNYYYCDYRSNSSTGIVTTTSQSSAAWTLQGTTSAGGFLFYQYESDKNQYIYYKSSASTFKFGNGGSDSGILLYKYNGSAN